jgi:putative heme iron utilization protein
VVDVRACGLWGERVILNTLFYIKKLEEVRGCPPCLYRNNADMLNRTMPDERLRQEIREFQAGFRSVMMATVNQDGVPEASYAPYVADDRGSYYVFVSGLARHTRDFQETGHVSVQFIENEEAGRNPFARRRLTLLCDVAAIPRESPVHDQVLSEFTRHFGKFVNTLRALPDFKLFRLMPRCGLYVRGFGQAFRV